MLDVGYYILPAQQSGSGVVVVIRIRITDNGIKAININTNTNIQYTASIPTSIVSRMIFLRRLHYYRFKTLM